MHEELKLGLVGTNRGNTRTCIKLFNNSGSDDIWVILNPKSSHTRNTTNTVIAVVLLPYCKTKSGDKALSIRGQSIEIIQEIRSIPQNWIPLVVELSLSTLNEPMPLQHMFKQLEGPGDQGRLHCSAGQQDAHLDKSVKLLCDDKREVWSTPEILTTKQLR